MNPSFKTRRDFSSFFSYKRNNGFCFENKNENINKEEKPSNSKLSNILNYDHGFNSYPLFSDFEIKNKKRGCIYEEKFDFKTEKSKLINRNLSENFFFLNKVDIEKDLESIYSGLKENNTSRKFSYLENEKLCSHLKENQRLDLNHCDPPIRTIFKNKSSPDILNSEKEIKTGLIEKKIIKSDHFNIKNNINCEEKKNIFQQAKQSINNKNDFKHTLNTNQNLTKKIDDLINFEKEEPDLNESQNKSKNEVFNNKSLATIVDLNSFYESDNNEELIKMDKGNYPNQTEFMNILHPKSYNEIKIPEDCVNEKNENNHFDLKYKMPNENLINDIFLNNNEVSTLNQSVYVIQKPLENINENIKNEENIADLTKDLVQKISKNDENKEELPIKHLNNSNNCNCELTNISYNIENLKVILGEKYDISENLLINNDLSNNLEGLEEKISEEFLMNKTNLLVKKDSQLHSNTRAQLIKDLQSFQVENYNEKLKMLFLKYNCGTVDELIVNDN